MQLVQTINQKCEETLPYYATVSAYTVEHYQQALDRLNNLYGQSRDKAHQMMKVSKQFQKDALWAISQAVDDILQFTENKIKIDPSASKQRSKTKRVLRIYNTLKQQHLWPQIQKVIDFNEAMLLKGKKYHQRYVMPIFFKVKATLLVSRQMFMEAFAERMTKLKMSIRCSKDSIIMFWSGEFKEEKIIEKVKEHFGSLKQFTIQFVQKGMEIKISKDELIENYHHIMEKMTEIMKGVSQKSVEQWAETKTKTLDLYNSVINRIKEKERLLRSQVVGIEFTEVSQVQAPPKTEINAETPQVPPKPQEGEENPVKQEQGVNPAGEQKQE